MEQTASELRVEATPLASLGKLLENEGIVLSAVRGRAEGAILDILTVATPPVTNDGRQPSRKSEHRAATVELANGPAVLHVEDRESSSGSPGRASIQLVLRIPPTSRGAIITMLSSEAGCEQMLEREAEGIAGSLRVESTG